MSEKAEKEQLLELSIEELEKLLNPRHVEFCHQYLVDLNASAAYRRAGYSANSRSSLDASASKLLRNHKIQVYLAKLRENLRESTNLENIDIINGLKAIAFSNISNVVNFTNDDCVVKSLDEIDSQTLSAIQSVSLKGGRVHVKLYDKATALRTLAQIFGLDGDISKSILTLANYGIRLYQDVNGVWQVKDEQAKLK